MSLDEALQEALFGEDELGVVIRAHIHIEARVNSLLEALVPFPDNLPHLRFDQKVNLAVALGLKRDSVTAIKELGKIRNRFGHKLDTCLTAEMVNEVFEGLSDEDREILMRGYEMTRTQVFSPQYESLVPREKFIIVCVGLDKLLVQAIGEANARGA